MYEFEREELVKNLFKKGIKNENVLNAFLNIHRHKFVPIALHHLAYKDHALPIGYSQTISQPYTVAVMTDLLNITKGDKILEIGTGSGFQAAILNFLGAEVYSIERSEQLHLIAKKTIDQLGLNIKLKLGDGTLGWKDFAPFNGIIVTAGGPSIPQSLKEQVAINGKLIIPVGDKNTQTMKLLVKINDNEYEEKDTPNFTFVPLVGKEGWKE